MKLQKSTLALLVVAIALGGGVLLFETQKADRGEVTEQRAGELIFDFEESDVQTLTLQRADETLTLQKDKDGIWRMTKPKREPAEPAAIAFLLSILTSDPSLQTLDATPDQLEQFGLNDPVATVTLTLQDETVHQLNVGGADFSGDSLYVTADLSGDEDAVPMGDTAEADNPIQVHLVSGGLSNAIERPVDGWLRQEEPTSDASEPETSDSETSDSEIPEAEAEAEVEAEAEAEAEVEAEAEAEAEVEAEVEAEAEAEVEAEAEEQDATPEEETPEDE